MKPIPYQDLAHLSEDAKISKLGAKIMEGHCVGIFIEDDKEKYDRYIKKVLLRYPEAVVEKNIVFQRGVRLIRFNKKKSDAVST